MRNSKRIYFCGLLAVMVFLVPQEAHAYIDPGTGSYIFQIAIAFLVGALFYMKLFGRSTKAFISRIFTRDQKGESENER